MASVDLQPAAVYGEPHSECGPSESSSAASSPEPSDAFQSSSSSSSSSSGASDRASTSDQSSNYDERDDAVDALALLRETDSIEHEQILMLDPSEHYRPDTHGKAVEEFRKYSHDEEDYIQRRVKLTYYQMHRNQTVEFVRGRLAEWRKFDRAQLTIMEALEKLNGLIDESDPDCDVPNIVHAFQTAERIRARHPDAGWLQLTGLIHDLGKVLAFWGEEQWAVVGDTYVVGCEFAPSIVYREHSFDECPDLNDSRYNTKFGIYKPHCGLTNVHFTSSHDTYMYEVLKNHRACSLPEAGLKIILLHSFYPWHTGGDYMHLCDAEDLKVLPLIREFNKFDLYTKSEPIPDIGQLVPYYQALIDKYIPGKLSW